MSANSVYILKTDASQKDIKCFDDGPHDEDLEKIRNKYISITFDSTNNDVENDSQSCEILDVDLVINSGSLFVLENLKNIGWHNEKYYVCA